MFSKSYPSKLLLKILYRWEKKGSWRVEEFWRFEGTFRTLNCTFLATQWIPHGLEKTAMNQYCHQQRPADVPLHLLIWFETSFLTTSDTQIFVNKKNLVCMKWFTNKQRIINSIEKLLYLQTTREQAFCSNPN